MRDNFTGKAHATAEELCKILGPHWAICRKTPRRIERYGRCITRREYNDAVRQALEARLVPHSWRPV